MSAFISSINYCPVKSVSFQNINGCEIKKNIGIVGDRIFAFSNGLDQKKTKLFENDPEERKGKWGKILTLKNSPVLNKYNFLYEEKKLTFTQKNEEILTIDCNIMSERELLSNKLLKLENSLTKPITLMKNEKYPFFDTSISKKTVLQHSISLLNINSINDFQNRIEQEIEISRFRGNICVDGIKAWEENKWIGKIIEINNIPFKVEKNIPRCVAINLKPGSHNDNIDLLRLLKKNYNHFDMGIYLNALGNGKLKIGDNILVK